jgi:aspartate 1-decarboxylase
MNISVLKSKIHRAIVTDANLDYEGSVTIDQDLLDAAHIYPYESIHIWNVTNGNRIMTYVLPGVRGSKVICINGSAAHHNHPGDIVILATFGSIDTIDHTYKPIVVKVDNKNNIIYDNIEDSLGIFN